MDKKNIFLFMFLLKVVLFLVYYEKKKMYLSCCVIVENIPRRIFLLPREKRFDAKANKMTDTAVTLLDVYKVKSENN